MKIANDVLAFLCRGLPLLRGGEARFIVWGTDIQQVEIAPGWRAKVGGGKWGYTDGERVSEDVVLLKAKKRKDTGLVAVVTARHEGDDIAIVNVSQVQAVRAEATMRGPF